MGPPRLFSFYSNASMWAIDNFLTRKQKTNLTFLLFGKKDRSTQNKFTTLGNKCFSMLHPQTTSLFQDACGITNIFTSTRSNKATSGKVFSMEQALVSWQTSNNLPHTNDNDETKEAFYSTGDFYDGDTQPFLSNEQPSSKYESTPLSSSTPQNERDFSPNNINNNKKQKGQKQKKIIIKRRRNKRKRRRKNKK